MIRIAINGALGRMGRAVGRLALESRKFSVAAALEAPGSPSLGEDYGSALGREPLGVALAARLDRKVDALVDFSTPEASLARLEECVRTKSPAVVCTTGFADGQRRTIRAAAKKIPVLLSPNMSVGVAALLRAVLELARLLGDSYDIEIVETHHRRKRDAPSGTAVSLAERLAAATGRAWPGDFRFGRKGTSAGRSPLEIGIHAIRAGGVVGEHTVIFASDDDVIEVTHRAGSRDLFARGALRAAAFVARAKPGLYGMEDVLMQPARP
jgi:4-hydroxy-tetrahydrodipicolinate reductase